MVQLRLIDVTDSPNVQDWTATTAVRAKEVRVQGGVLYRRKADGTTRPTFDATELALWDALGGGGSTYTDEQAQDAVAALFSAGTDTGITFTYDDAGNRISATVTAGGSSASGTTFTPAGGIAATNVQAALVELDTEKETVAHASATYGLARTTVKTAAYTAVAGDLVPVDTTTTAVTVTLPNAPVDGAQVGVKLVTLGTGKAVTIAAAGSAVFNKTGGSTSLTLSLLNQGVVLRYATTSAIWTAVSTDVPLSALVQYPSGGIDGQALVKSGTGTTLGPIVPASYLRGVNTQGGGSNIDDGTKVPGVLGTDYFYNSQAFYNYIASRGHTIVRLDFLWERVQPTLNGALSSGIEDLRTAVRRANTAGLKVLLDMKNYGRYWNNSTTRVMFGSGITSAWFADAWSRIVTALASEKNIVAWGLMNEPYGLPAHPTQGQTYWKEFSQAAVTAIRATGDTRDIFVAGDQFDGAWNWTGYNGAPWITDPANATVYEVHLYLDHDRSGQYGQNYADTVAADVAQGWLSIDARVNADLDNYLGWLTTYKQRGFVGEIGWPNGTDATSWNALAQKVYDRLNAAGIGVTYWASGERWVNYPLDAYGAASFTPATQTAVIESPLNTSRPNSPVGPARVIETAPKVRPTGAWDFTVSPTVGGSPIGGSAAPEYAIGSGAWWTPSVSATGTGALNLVNLMVLSNLRLPAALSMSACAVEVSTAAGAGGLLRAGFYGSDANGNCDLTNLLVDLGTQASTATGVKTFTPGTPVALPRGIIWFALVAQTATCTVRTSTGGNELALPLPSGTAPPVGSNIQVLNVGGISAGLPTSGSPGAGTTLIAPPKLYLKAA